MVKDAREIVALFRKGGVDQKKIVISVRAILWGFLVAPDSIIPLDSCHGSRRRSCEGAEE